MRLRPTPARFSGEGYESQRGGFARVVVAGPPYGHFEVATPSDRGTPAYRQGSGAGRLPGTGRLAWSRVNSLDTIGPEKGKYFDRPNCSSTLNTFGYTMGFSFSSTARRTRARGTAQGREPHKQGKRAYAHVRHPLREGPFA